eukprot:TRINITY_DN5047_c0_g1_i2.p1 TRINITY_DN5047_c0_g1~~TRINITY_DN5047_c0_g1_i2.p1  ORF type:complete len:338 (+),score=82.36 TRINITY_DN5047_c0_g1_i2:89-1102(+)
MDRLRESPKQNLLIKMDHEELLNLIDKQVVSHTVHLQNQISELHEKINGLNQLVSNFKKSQRSRKKSQLTKEERDLCLFVYSLCLKGVKDRLSDLPLVRGNLEASKRVDGLVDELYANHNEVKKAVDSNPPVLTKNDIRLHILNVMVEQRRRKRRSKNPTKKRKREDEEDIDSNIDNNNSNSNDNIIYENHQLPTGIKKFNDEIIHNKVNSNSNNNNDDESNNDNNNERDRIFNHTTIPNHDDNINDDHDQINDRHRLEKSEELEFHQNHEFNDHNTFSAEYYYQNFDNFEDSGSSSSANDILFSLMVEEENEQQNLGSGSSFDHVNEPPKKKFKTV